MEVVTTGLDQVDLDKGEPNSQEEPKEMAQQDGNESEDSSDNEPIDEPIDTFGGKPDSSTPTIYQVDSEWAK